MKRKGLCLTLSAPSGGGKTTIIKAMLNALPELRHSISYTTRPPRHTERADAYYHHIGVDQFSVLRENGEFLEWAEVHGNFYGTRRSDLESILNEGYDVILDIDVQGASQLRDRFPEGIQVFIMPPSLQILEERLRARGSDSDEIINRRLQNATLEMQAYADYDYVVINDELDNAIDSIRSILIAEHCKLSRFIRQTDCVD